MNARLLGLDGVSIRELTDEEIAGWAALTSAGNMFEYIEQNCTRENIMVGTIPLDGQPTNDAVFPEAIAAVRAGKQKAVSEDDWQADPKKRFMWSLGGGFGPTAWVRPPDLNGVQPGSLKPAYIRGAATDAQVGTGHGDAIRNITGAIGGIGYNTRESVFDPSGAITLQGGDTAVSTNNGTGGRGRTGFALDASLVVPVADENRGVGAHYLWTVRVFGTVSNPGNVDASQLATDLAVANAKISALQASIPAQVTLYPNGTQAAPASIAINTRVLVTNPFPGKRVQCLAEIRVNGVWSQTGFIFTNNGGYGVSAGQISASQLVVRSGKNAVVAPSDSGGSSNEIPESIATSAPYRLVVTSEGAYQ